MSIPYVVDGETDLDSALFNPIIDAVNDATSAVANIGAGTFNVLDYHAVGDGVTDDTAAIQSAIDAAEAAGGGTIWLPAGKTFLCNTVTSDANDYIFSVNGSDLLFTGDGTLKTTEAAALISFNTDKTSLNDLATIYTMTSAAVADSTITLATPAQAGNFSAGDWVLVRTGQTLDLPGGRQPDAEMNRIVSANANTGVLTLQFALAKSYAQEAVDTGSGYTYASAVGGGGANVAFGVANADGEVTENVTFDGIKFISRSGVPAIIGGNIAGLTIQNCDFDLDATVASHGVIRSARLRNNRIRIQSVAGDDYIFSPNTCSTDFLIEGNDVASTKSCYMHIHEGAAGIKVFNNTIRNTHVAADRNAISIRARAYDVQIIGNTIVNAGNANVIFVDESCPGGGVIAFNRVVSPNINSIVVASPGWQVHSNDVDGDVGIFAPGVHAPVMSVSGWIEHDKQSITLGRIPAAFAVLRVHCRVAEAFNSDGADEIIVGYSGDTDAYATAIDVSTTGVKAVTLGAKVLREDNLSRIITAAYTNGGTEPSTGQALVIVEYIPVEWLD